MTICFYPYNHSRMRSTHTGGSLHNQTKWDGERQVPLATRPGGKSTKKEKEDTFHPQVQTSSLSYRATLT